MKRNYWLILGMMVATVATAQTSSNTLPPIPAPAATVATPGVAPVVLPATSPTNAPAIKHHTKHHKKAETSAPVAHKTDKIIFSEASVTLVPGPAVVGADNLNVRGQAGIKGEVVAHVKKGDTVNVVSEITLDKHKADEPAQWAKITLPTGASVWVNSSFINVTDKTVKAKKLNLRAGPSEDYSVIGVIERGTMVNALETKGGWTKIEAPTNAYAFIAAMYLSQGASGAAPTNFAPTTEVGTSGAPATTIPATMLTPVPAPEPTPVAPTPVIVPAPAPVPAPNNNSTLLPPPIANDTNALSPPDANAAAAAAADAVPAFDPSVPRIVTHEGRVRSTISLVAPTYYELYDPATMIPVDYLHSTTTNLNLSRYDGFKVIVTGQEGMDARWKDTPVLTVQKIYVLDTNVPQTKILYSPRASQNH